MLNSNIIENLKQYEEQKSNIKNNYYLKWNIYRLANPFKIGNTTIEYGLIVSNNISNKFSSIFHIIPVTKREVNGLYIINIALFDLIESELNLICNHITIVKRDNLKYKVGTIENDENTIKKIDCILKEVLS